MPLVHGVRQDGDNYRKTKSYLEVDLRRAPELYTLLLRRIFDFEERIDGGASLKVLLPFLDGIGAG